MNFSIWTSHLGRALDHAILGFLPTSGDDYSLVSLRLCDGYIVVFSSAPEASVSVKFPSDCTAVEDDIVVYGRLLQSICKQARGESMDFSLNTDDGMLSISSGAASWKIRTNIKRLALIDDSNETVHEIDAESLREALKEVNYAVGVDSGRAYLAMVNIREGKAQACDGLRYHEIQTSASDLSLSIRAGLVKPIVGWLSHYSEEDTVRVSSSERFDHLRVDQHNYSVTVSAMRTTSKFPDLDGIMIKSIKSQVPSLLRIGKTDLVSGLRQVKVLSEKDEPVVEVAFDAESVLLRCFKRDGTEATAVVPGHWSSSNRLAAFDVNSFLEFVTAFDEEELELRFGKDSRDRKSPVALASNNSWAMLNQVKVLNKK